MSLFFSPRVNNQFLISCAAKRNINKLLHVNPHGGKEQVATQAALQCLERIKELRSGYFDGINSWAKSCRAYMLAGTVAVFALGGTGITICKIGQSAINAGYGAHLLGGAFLIGGMCRELKFSPITALSALFTIVCDSANRAAKLSITEDERNRDAKEKERQGCHKEIFNQLLWVYNDCANYLAKECKKSETDENSNNQLALKEIGSRLNERLPVIENLLKQMDLDKYEIEFVLQRLKEKILLVQAENR